MRSRMTLSIRVAWRWHRHRNTVVILRCRLFVVLRRVCLCSLENAICEPRGFVHAVDVLEP